MHNFNNTQTKSVLVTKALHASWPSGISWLSRASLTLFVLLFSPILSLTNHIGYWKPFDDNFIFTRLRYPCQYGWERQHGCAYASAWVSEPQRGYIRVLKSQLFWLLAYAAKHSRLKSSFCTSPVHKTWPRYVVISVVISQYKGQTPINNRGWGRTIILCVFYILKMYWWCVVACSIHKHSLLCIFFVQSLELNIATSWSHLTVTRAIVTKQYANWHQPPRVSADTTPHTAASTNSSANASAPAIVSGTVVVLWLLTLSPSAVAAKLFNWKKEKCYIYSAWIVNAIQKCTLPLRDIFFIKCWLKKKKNREKVWVREQKSPPFLHNFHILTYWD